MINMIWGSRIGLDDKASLAEILFPNESRVVANLLVTCPRSDGNNLVGYYNFPFFRKHNIFLTWKMSFGALPEE